MIPEDIKGEVLKKQIQEYLKETGSGSILAINIVPNFADLIRCEAERKLLKLLSRLLQADEELQSWFWIPKRLRDKDEFQKALKELDD